MAQFFLQQNLGIWKVDILLLNLELNGYYMKDLLNLVEETWKGTLEVHMHISWQRKLNISKGNSEKSCYDSASH